MNEAARFVSEGRKHIPFYVPVSLGEGLFDCFSVHLGPEVLAVSASLGTGAAPAAGEVLRARLTLPDGVEIAAPVRVEWVQTRSARGGLLPSVVFGATFASMPAATRAHLQRTVAAYRPRVAIVDRRRAPLAGLAALLPDLDLVTVGDIESFYALQTQPPFSAVVLTDLRDSADALGSLCASYVDEEEWLNAVHFATLAPRVVFAGSAPADQLLALHNAAKLFRSVAPDDLLTLASAIRSAVIDFSVRSELKELPHAAGPAVAEEPPALRALVHTAPAMRAAVALVRRVAPLSTAVLIAGETGTGKELLARALHELSPRAPRPFIAQDCAALSEALLDSELFGHVRGAFTGAVAGHPGLFAAADGGTLFLDEIENTSPALQARLLRVLESGEVRPVGGAAARRVDVRVVAATNCDLREAVRRGGFRADLYYRLDRITITVPPLRERTDDLLPLARLFLGRLAAELGRPVPSLADDFVAALARYPWPGNVRELRNAVERAVLVAGDAERLDARLLPAHVFASAAAPPSLRSRLAEVERALIADALARCGGVLRSAARSLDMDAVTLARRARKLGLR